MSDSAACSRLTWRWRHMTWTPLLLDRGRRPRGAAITERSLEGIRGRRDERLDRLTFLDLDLEIVERERSRVAGERRSGPTAEDILATLALSRPGSVEGGSLTSQPGLIKWQLCRRQSPR